MCIGIQVLDAIKCNNSIDNYLRVESPQLGRWYIGVYGREAADFVLTPTLNCGANRELVGTQCKCIDRCFTGPQCDEGVKIR